MWLLLFLFIKALSPKDTPSCEVGLPVNYDTIYSPDIASVKCHIKELPLSMPIIQLNNSTWLDIYFDDLNGSDRRYRYELVHVDKNWKKDELDEIEYIDGFNRSEIRNRTYSTNRDVDYTHYKFILPNADIKLTKSGNYLLHVYEEIKRGLRNYIFTKRILVTDPKLNIDFQVLRANGSEHYRTHHEVDFVIHSKGFNVYDPKNEITASVVQNGNWSTLISNLKHNREKTEQFIFDYTDKIIFPAGKQYRFFDIRAIEYRSRWVKKITQNNNETIITLEDDRSRQEINYLNYVDINGNYVLDNLSLDEFGILVNRKLEDSVRKVYSKLASSIENVNLIRNPNITSEYVWVDFTLLSDEFRGLKVYVTGQFSDWQCKSQFLMKYDPATNAYLGSALLKQGYYNYQYTTQDQQGNISTELIEGDWSETENEYQILIYYRPFGSRYDQLIGFVTAKF